jgi:GMP reductase
MHIIHEPQYDFCDVLMKPKRSSLGSRADVDLRRTFKGLHGNKEISCIPIVAANMDNIATVAMAKVLAEYGMLTAMSKFTSPEDWHTLGYSSTGHFTIPTIGIRAKEEYENYRNLAKEHSHIYEKLLIDVPNGYTERFLNFVARVRKENPDIFIIAGNVVSAEQVEEILTRGADCVKIGIGPGSACTTRVKSGVGRPQFSTIVECANAAHGLDGYVMADGGCTTPGDVAKAFGAGADFVMIGGMLAGHDECDGEVIKKHELDYYDEGEMGYNEVEPIDDGKLHWRLPDLPDPPVIPVYKERKFKEFWGMSSTKAMEKHYGEQAKYKASEGREVLVPYRGPVEDTVQDILGGIRSACTYIGARKIKHMSKCASFYVVNRQVNNPYE